MHTATLTAHAIHKAQTRLLPRYPEIQEHDLQNWLTTLTLEAIDTWKYSYPMGDGVYAFTKNGLVLIIRIDDQKDIPVLLTTYTSSRWKVKRKSIMHKKRQHAQLR